VLGVVAVIGGLHRQRRLAGSAAHASRWQPLIILATGLTSAMPSCVQGRQLVIADIEAVHAELAGRGTPGRWHELFAVGERKPFAGFPAVSPRSWLPDWS
jgi:hypothetical protein